MTKCKCIHCSNVDEVPTQMNYQMKRLFRINMILSYRLRNHADTFNFFHPDFQSFFLVYCCQ